MTALTMVQKRQAMAQKARSEIQEKMGRREKAVKPTEGRSKWRILPSWRGAEDPDIAHAFGQHFVKDAAGDLKAVHMCLDKTYGKPCPICDALTHAIRNSDDNTQKLLKESQASGGFLLNALNAKGEVVLLQLTPTTYEKLLDLMDQYADDGLDLIDINAGFDIIITREGKGMQTKYSINPAPKSTKVPESVLENLTDLDAYVKQMHEETQNKALAVVDMVATGRRLPAPASNANSLDDDGDLFDDDVLDAEFEEAKPAAKAKPASKSVSDSEIDDLLGELDDLDL